MLRRSMRQSSTAIASLEPLLEMIPDETGLSILRGGIYTVFKVVSFKHRCLAYTTNMSMLVPAKAENESRQDIRGIWDNTEFVCGSS